MAEKVVAENTSPWSNRQLSNDFRYYLDDIDTRDVYPRVNDVLVKNGLRINGQIKVENGVPMMRKDYRADFYCEDNRTVGYNETFEQAYKKCADLGLEISFFPGMFQS